MALEYADLELRIASLEERVARQEQEIRAATRCPRCLGSGGIYTKDGPDECPACQGTGKRP